MDTRSPDRCSWVAQVLSDWNLRLCSVVTLLIVCLPPEGIPHFELCYFKSLTGAPCPGCGICRSGANLARGNLSRAMNYNPFGVIVIPVLFGLGLLGLAPRSWREAVRRRLLHWDQPIRIAFWTMAIGFVVFGIVRWLSVFEGWSDFPASRL